MALFSLQLYAASFSSIPCGTTQVGQSVRPTMPPMCSGHMLSRSSLGRPQILSSSIQSRHLRKPAQGPQTNPFGGASIWRLWSSNSITPMQHRRRSPVSASLVGAASVELASALFTFGTAFVLPFYSVMIFAPQWEWTKKLMSSDLTFIVLGALYIYLLCCSWTPETFGLMFGSSQWLPELPGITRMFSRPVTVASAWIHLVAVDLFSGRHIFLDGLQQNVETRHSLVLCLMMCPIGIFVHVVTKAMTLFLRRSNNNALEEISSISVL